MNREERLFWRNFFLIRTPMAWAGCILTYLIFAATTVDIHYKDRDSLNLLEQSLTDSDLRPFVLKGDWFNYYKTAMLSGVATGVTVTTMFAFINAGIMIRNRRQG
jgi:hypothetical protein